MYPSTLSSWALLIAKALEAKGCDVQKIFIEAGLDPEKLNVAGARYSQAAMRKLWQLAAEATDDCYFGLHISEYWHPTTFNALGFSWLASHSLQDAFQRLQRYASIITNVLIVHFEQQGDQYCFSFDSKIDIPEPMPLAADAGISTIIRMCRLNFGHDLNPVRIMTTRPEPDSIDEFVRLYKCPIEFSAKINSLFFKQVDIEQQLPTANADLALKGDQLAMEYLARYEHDDIVLKLKSIFVNDLPTGDINENSIAGAVNMSTRTLQRKLQQQGTSIKTLLDETRKELAMHYLEHSSLTIGEITYLLGFSEPANFSRAFKRWTNQTPSCYRTAA